MRAMSKNLRRALLPAPGCLLLICAGCTPGADRPAASASAQGTGPGTPAPAPAAPQAAAGPAAPAPPAATGTAPPGVVSPNSGAPAPGADANAQAKLDAALQLRKSSKYDEAIALLREGHA